ncbi:aspartate ammonia-lyase [Maridesulfovibrio zosterae]|uniref:aspartate ammonia-lyase n=1 Tax=Maridesulfovibrio zosterae TaxID=82171 RepID=UPI000428C139|nr:aspartate ammonia-lyase [Maridesulfovibrio zosterae]
MSSNFRTENDAFGSIEIPSAAMYGPHTARAMQNFKLSGQRLSSIFIRSYAEVKLACARTNTKLGFLEQHIAQAIEMACLEMIEGDHHEHITVDAFQGGAGTSTNMNINEVLANRASMLLGKPYGSYEVHPLHHLNLHQSTNDTFPTALRVAALHELKRLEQPIADMQATLQRKEQEYNNLIRIARTQLQDAVPVTAGMTFGAWAEALSRDRWRIFKCRERIKQVNLGGTAVGTGLGAPRDYILRVTDELRHITGLKIARAENLVDVTQNLDSLVEVSAMLKACAVNLFKISNDVRLLSSGPSAGMGELCIPPLQIGSTIMPGKVNPVIPEAVSQAALRVMSNDSLAGQVAALGNLELNQFMPLMAQCLLESLNLLNNAVPMLHRLCLENAVPDAEKCTRNVYAGKSLITILVPYVGYEKAEQIARHADDNNISIIEAAAKELDLDPKIIAELFSPDRMRQLGYSEDTYSALNFIEEES